MKIHEYGNELICILEFKVKGQCLSFYLVPILSIYVEQWLRYG